MVCHLTKICALLNERFPNDVVYFIYYGMCKIDDKRMNEHTIKTMNTTWKKKNRMWRLHNMTFDNVIISKIHNDKCVNKCTIGTMNTRWKTKIRQWRLENVALSSTDDLIAILTCD